MISDKTIEQLQEAVHTIILKDSVGEEYSSRPVYVLPIKKIPQPEPLRISTLTGFVDYIQSHAKDAPNEHFSMVHIVSHKEVRLVSQLYGPSQRDIFTIAACEDLFGKSFMFGAYYDHESFVISLQTLFVNTPEREQVLRVIGTIKENSVRESSDDGISQSVTARAGIALVSDVLVPNPVNLRPYRSFRELEQPISPFVLRVQPAHEGSKPQCALFEADGGQWKIDAIDAIRKYLEAHNLGVPIIA